MKKLLNDIISKYKEPLDARIIDFLTYVTSSLENENDYTKIVLNMLVPQLIIYYKALDNMQTTSDVTHNDDYNRKSKAPEIGVMQKANDQILNLLDKLVLSPIEKAKLKRINKSEEDDAKDLLESLMK